MLILIVLCVFFSHYNLVNSVQLRKAKFNESQMKEHLHKSILEIQSLLKDVKHEIQRDRSALRFTDFDLASLTESGFMDYSIKDTWWEGDDAQETSPQTLSTLFPTLPFIFTAPDLDYLETRPTLLNASIMLTPPAFPIPETSPNLPDEPEYGIYQETEGGPFTTSGVGIDPETPPITMPETEEPEYTIIPGFPITIPKEIFSIYPEPPPFEERHPYPGRPSTFPLLSDYPEIPPHFTPDDPPPVVNITTPPFPIPLLNFTTDQPSLPNALPTFSSPEFTYPALGEIPSFDFTYEPGFPSIQFTNVVYTLFPGVTPEPGVSTDYPPPPLQTYIPDFLTAILYSLTLTGPTTDTAIHQPTSEKPTLAQPSSEPPKTEQFTSEHPTSDSQSDIPVYLRNIARAQSSTTSDNVYMKRWLHQSTDYTPVENWLRRLTTKTVKSRYNYYANRHITQDEDSPPQNWVRSKYSKTKSSPAVYRQGISLPDAYTQPQDYGFSIATGQNDKFLGENELGMYVLGTTPLPGDHTMTTMVNGMPAYKPYEPTTASTAGDVLHGEIKVMPPGGFGPGGPGGYPGPGGMPGPGDMPGPGPEDMAGPREEPRPGMKLPPGMVSPYKRFDDMMDELNEGYMIVFLLELTRLIAEKEPEHVYGVIGHTEIITNDLYEKARLAWFGQPLAEVVMSLGRFLTEAEIDAVRSYASMMHHLLRTRRSALAADVNSIIDYADLLYEHDEGYTLFDSIMEFERYPNMTRTSREVCDSLIEEFLRPFRRLYHSERRQALLDSVNYALKIRFPEYANMRRSNEELAHGKGKNRKRRHRKHSKKFRKQRQLRKIQERRKRYRKYRKQRHHRLPRIQTNADIQRRHNMENNNLEARNMNFKPEVKRRYVIATSKQHFKGKTTFTNPKFNLRSTPSMNIFKINKQKKFNKATNFFQDNTHVQQKHKIQKEVTKKKSHKYATSIYLKRGNLKDDTEDKEKDKFKAGPQEEIIEDSDNSDSNTSRKINMIQDAMNEDRSNEDTIDDSYDHKIEQKRRSQHYRKAPVKF